MCFHLGSTGHRRTSCCCWGTSHGRSRCILKAPQPGGTRQCIASLLHCGNRSREPHLLKGTCFHLGSTGHQRTSFCCWGTSRGRSRGNCLATGLTLRMPLLLHCGNRQREPHWLKGMCFHLGSTGHQRTSCCCWGTSHGRSRCILKAPQPGGTRQCIASLLHCGNRSREPHLLKGTCFHLGSTGHQRTSCCCWGTSRGRSHGNSPATGLTLRMPLL